MSTHRFTAALTTLGLIGSMALPLATHANTTTAFNSGDLIEGLVLPCITFGANGRRFVSKQKPILPGTPIFSSRSNPRRSAGNDSFGRKRHLSP